MSRSTVVQENRVDYHAYIKSDAWKTRRAKVFTAAKGICLACGRRAETVHHRSYERLGAEGDTDLVALCWDCHQACHMHHVEHADWGLWKATNAVIAERRALFGLPLVRLPRERRRKQAKKRPRRDRGSGRDPMASPALVAVRSVPCPKCKAGVSELCLTDDGTPRRGGVNHGLRASVYGRGPAPITVAEIEAGRSAAGGWTRAQLAAWGVPWPPPKGWLRQLLEDAES